MARTNMNRYCVNFIYNNKLKQFKALKKDEYKQKHIINYE